MIKDTQEYLQHWEKENNPFYPSEMRWDRLQVNRFLKDYKKQLTLTDVGGSFSQNDMENFAAKCMILGSGGKDTKELLKDFCDNDR